MRSINSTADAGTTARGRQPCLLIARIHWRLAKHDAWLAVLSAAVAWLAWRGR